jgi:3-deoxy-D-manno-octulosonate 8-phosphate phosphatase (KDO 8-P phosphatase)
LEALKDKIAKIKFLFTDVDGVLTDAGVYYSASGEALKKFSLRDGMGAERLRKLTEVQIGIITGEQSEIVKRRAEKLNIQELHLGIKDKLSLLKERIKLLGISMEEVAYIGDDMNDLEVIEHAGLTAAPEDAVEEIISRVHYTCRAKGGQGAFREFCELIIKYK